MKVGQIEEDGVSTVDERKHENVLSFISKIVKIEVVYAI